MGSDNNLFHSNSSTRLHTPRHWERRDFVKGVAALGGAAGLSGYMRSATAEPPPETTTLRILEVPISCLAPQYAAQELLLAEGFTDVRFVSYPSDTQNWAPDVLLSGEADISFSFPPTDILRIDAGAPVVILVPC
jgi:NitT/TauT family transport system substrate-binding protein